MTLVGFFGLWFCKHLRESEGLTGPQFMQTRASEAVWLFSAYWVIGLFVLFPASVMLQKRVGVPIEGPTVPRWIGWTLITIALALASLIILVLLGIALTTLLHA